MKINIIYKSRLCILIIAATILCTVCNAQKIAPQSISNSGHNIVHSIGSLSYILGELTILTYTDINGNSLGSGFMSGATLTTMSIQEPDFTIFDIAVYPNPTSDILYIDINYPFNTQIIIVITDLLGKEMYSETLSPGNQNFKVKIEDLDKGIYILNIKRKNEKTFAAYKILKH